MVSILSWFFRHSFLQSISALLFFRVLFDFVSLFNKCIAFVAKEFNEIPKVYFWAAFAKNFPIMGITWATGLRFRPVTIRLEAWDEEHVVVNCLCLFTKL